MSRHGAALIGAVTSAFLALVTPPTAEAQGTPAPADCNRAAAEASITLDMPGNPFAAVSSADGCWIFVSMPVGANGPPGGIAVVRRSAGRLALTRTVPVDSNPTGLVLTHDGALLIAADGHRVAVLDVGRLTRGDSGAVLGYFADGGTPGRIYVNVTADDRILFVANERSASISVIDLAASRASRFTSWKPIGRIATGNSPIALTFSADGKHLYTTAQAAPPALNWPNTCKPEGADPATAAPNHPKGIILVVDVALASVTPASSVVSVLAAGCNPVRLVTSPDGNTAYVSVRNENSLFVYDTRRFLSDSAHARTAVVPAGTAPVGVAVIDNGRRVVVTSSNRFGGDSDDRQFLTVIDATRTTQGAAATLGTIAAGAFPRELRVTADGKTLLLTNFASKSLQVIDIARLPLVPAKP